MTAAALVAVLCLAGPPLEAPQPPAQLSVEIDAFRREGGAMVRLAARANTAADSYRWFSVPEIEDFEPVPGDGSTLFLATRHTGHYRVYVVVAAVIGGKAQTAIAYRDLDFTKAEDPMPARVTAAKQGRPGPREIISQAALAVKSPTWPQDRTAVVMAYRSAPTAAEAVSRARVATGPAWEPFFAAMARLEAALAAEGALTGGDRERQHLLKTAAVLESLQPPR